MVEKRTCRAGHNHVQHCLTIIMSSSLFNEDFMKLGNRTRSGGCIGMYLQRLVEHDCIVFFE